MKKGAGVYLLNQVYFTKSRFTKASLGYTRQKVC